MTPYDGHYLAGLVDGEGCFNIKPDSKGKSLSCQFGMHLRNDDRPLIEHLREITGLGVIYHGRTTTATGDRADSPSVQWRIHKKADALKVVELFRRYPLRSKKARDFEIWTLAVYAWHRGDWPEMERLRGVLRTIRAYDAGDIDDGWEESPFPQLEMELA